MTLVATWLKSGTLYVIADSRLTQPSGTGVLTDSAPKITTLALKCYSQGKDGFFDSIKLDTEIGVAYAGSSTVAFSLIATIQAHLNYIPILHPDNIPTLSQISEFATEILEDNFKQFGVLWEKNARCKLLIFGSFDESMPEAFEISADVLEGEANTSCRQLPLMKEDRCVAIGSAAQFFEGEVKKDRKDSGKLRPHRTLLRILEEGNRSDVGGDIQLAISHHGSTWLPAIVREEDVLGEGVSRASIKFLGRDIGKFGLVKDNYLFGRNFYLSALD